MFYRLADHASYALFEDIAIFLDLRADRYVALATAPNSRLRASLEGKSTDFGGPEFTELIDRGLLITTTAGTMPISPASAAVPTASALETGGTRPALDRKTACAVATCLAARHHRPTPGSRPANAKWWSCSASS